MPEVHEFENDLREMIDRRQVVAIVGSGVSIATNPQAPTWRGLIESAVERCRTLGVPDDWCEYVKTQLSQKYADMLLSAAELAHQRLREFGEGEWARWLRETFESLQPVDRTIIEALVALEIPLITTNYDDLIEKVTGLKYVTPKDPRHVANVVHGNDRRVLHLHGHWDESDSVVLGIRSYEEVKSNSHIQAVLRAWGVTKSLLFVGCGDEGLTDPNLGRFLGWLKRIETEVGVEHRHYRLVRQQDVFEPRGRLFAIAYGNEYADLPTFLQRLRPQRAHVGGDRSRAQLTALPDSITAYVARLADDTSRLRLIGMGRSLQIELPIEDAYVPLRTTFCRSLGLRPAERFTAHLAEVEEDVEIAEVFRRAEQLGQRGVVLLGEPGAGKTTGARQIAWRLASGQCLPEDLGLPAGTIPVLLRFRNLRPATLAKSNGLRTFLADETQCDTAPDGLAAPGKELWNRGGLLWILDGLDEVIDPAARKTVSTWVEKALTGRPNDRFLVTCRFAGFYRDGARMLGSNFVEFHVRPLEDEQVERFVREWFGTAYKKLLHPAALAESRASKLLEIVSRPAYLAGHIRELCTNPLLLTILCIVFHDEQTLPTNRAELYALCVRVLLQHWRRDLYEAELGGGVKPYDAEAAQAVLSRVAWWMHSEQDRTAAPLGDLAAEAERGLADVAASCALGQDGEKFVERMKDEAGILANDGDGYCGFLHLSFQEYLAADYAARENKAGELAPRVVESWWSEVALLSLRRSRPYCEEFFRELLAAGIVEARPDLAERCLAEALYFPPAPFVDALRKGHSPRRVAAVLRLLRDRAEQVPELVDIARSLAEDDDTETRGFAREILAHLGIAPPVGTERNIIVDGGTGIAFVRIPAGSLVVVSLRQTVHPVQSFWLGKYPVTNAQYAQFMKDVGGKVQEPASWDDRRFNQPEQPVSGVNRHEARFFCEWSGGRLPTSAEWEYACRAGTTTVYPFGDDPALLGEHAWFDKNSGGQTHPVGTKKPNGWGLYDMLGNVYEWCQDRREVDPSSPNNLKLCILRGGAFGFGASYCHPARRATVPSNLRHRAVGFRVAKS